MPRDRTERISFELGNKQQTEGSPWVLQTETLGPTAVRGGDSAPDPTGGKPGRGRGDDRLPSPPQIRILSFLHRNRPPVLGGAPQALCPPP